MLLKAIRKTHLMLLKAICKTIGSFKDCHIIEIKTMEIRNIKKIMALVVVATTAMITATEGIAQTEQTDTLIKIDSPSTLTITENESGMRVTVEGSQGEDRFNVTTFTEYTPDASVTASKNPIKKDWFDRWADGIMQKNKKGGCSWDLLMSGVAIGLIDPINQAPAGGLQWSKSFEISWLSCIGVKYGNSRSSISLGFGFDWRNYKITTSDKCLVANDDKGIEWGSYPAGTRSKNSRLKVFSLQLPLLYSWVIPKSSLVFKCGLIFNFNTYASLKTAYWDADGNKMEDFTTAISPRRFTVDFFGCLSYRHAIGLYVRYSPIKVMDAPNTLNFQPLSVGVTFGI